ncbi:MAG TPA: ABC transporter permease [Mycobacteriales bacterium]|nr:ABC transporter permease [Mycobacteriales bacterium]
MSARRTLATARRVLTQLRSDHRTIALLLVVPCVLLTLFKYVYASSPGVFDRAGLPMLGVFPLVTMFLVTSIAMVRERTTGTLERLLTTPLAKLDLLVGYALAFGLLALVQAGLVSAVALGLLGLDIRAGVGVVLVVAVANALLGMALGLLLSAFAQNEFQAVQFLPAGILPQVLLCGLLTPRDRMASWLTAVSDVLPMSYSVDALVQASRSAAVTSTLVTDVGIVLGCMVAALALGAVTLRRRTG